jgi:hypothetical protein
MTKTKTRLVVRAVYSNGRTRIVSQYKFLDNMG